MTDEPDDDAHPPQHPGPGYVNQLAAAVRCPRYMPKMAGCGYDAGKPCYCREWVELIYGDHNR